MNKKLAWAIVVLSILLLLVGASIYSVKDTQNYFEQKARSSPISGYENNCGVCEALVQSALVVVNYRDGVLTSCRARVAASGYGDCATEAQLYFEASIKHANAVTRWSSCLMNYAPDC